MYSCDVTRRDQPSFLGCFFMQAMKLQCDRFTEPNNLKQSPRLKLFPKRHIATSLHDLDWSKVETWPVHMETPTLKKEKKGKKRGYYR